MTEAVKPRRRILRPAIALALKGFLCLWLLILALLVIVPQLLAESADATVYEHKSQREVTWQQKVNPLFWWGNEDDPLPPADYLPDDNGRTFKWYCRNPLHNFTFYVIGIADRTFERKGRFADRVFAEAGGWNWAVCKYSLMRLPFISYKNSDMQAYWGWRESGNFGMKFNLFHKKSQAF